ncbi:hypothetical protein D3C85_1404520 [compost metagenome]
MAFNIFFLAIVFDRGDHPCAVVNARHQRSGVAHLHIGQFLEMLNHNGGKLVLTEM